ncbi:UNVERIFIED_CONTAM: Retrovirus-related Pol polyprotein from transposon RE2 [Sesamum latifolium]|uniref:Retrovirus-related Pol polyprotein from transposon RE2 n=1 Tax=Sesamum latifolium TaxID=2727402 RepID=A0AAW2WS39_9LAMI
MNSWLLCLQFKNLESYTHAKEHTEWQQAMHQELTALKENKTWKVVELLPDKRAIGYKWVYKVKLKPDGSVDRYKACFVAKGYNKIEGIDFIVLFSPLAKASRQWNQAFTSQLMKFGFVQSQNDHCLFIKTGVRGVIFLLIYVDDVLITSSNESLISPVKDYLHKLFIVKDMGSAKYFLGLEIAHSSAGTSVTQQKYIRDLIADAGLEHAKLIGRLLYLGFTRPDISYGAQQLSQFVHRPYQHLDVALHLVRYLTGLLPKVYSFMSITSFSLKAYCDVDWKQPTISRSSVEAEYRSVASTVRELQWISYLLQDFQVPFQTLIPLFCDNQAVVYITANPIFYECTKHLETDCHLVREKYKEGFVLPSHIFGKQQLADVFTKSLLGPAFFALLFKLGLVDFSPSPICGGLLSLPLCSYQFT